MSDTRLAALTDAIETRRARLAVIGLGYVGLPVACLFADSGYNVVGIDVDAARIDTINSGISPIGGIEPGLSDLLAKVVGQGSLRATTNYDDLADAQVFLIAVDTPVDPENNKPSYRSLRAALRSLGGVIQPGSLVIIESTCAPGTADRVVVPTLAEVSGLTPTVDFWIGHCPERVMPGRLLHNLQNMDRVVGGSSSEVAQAMIKLYRAYVKGTLDPTDPLTAELVKTGENAYRDVNIAFANEMALICEAVGGDVWGVRTLLNKSPGRNMLLPGAGVGGHCIPKDPWLLAFGADGVVAPRLISSARAVNESMPSHVADLMLDVLNQAGVNVDDAKIAVLGYSYLENSDDVRHTPTAELLKTLETLGCEITIHDPFVPEYAGDVGATLQDADCAVIMVAHNQYKELDLKAVADTLRHALLVDGRNIYSEVALKAAGFTYRVLGKAPAKTTTTPV